MSISIREIDSESVRTVLQRPVSEAPAHIVLARAREAAEGSGYAGDVTAPQAWALFSSGIADLVDVRTRSELESVGRVPKAGHVEWLRDEDRRQNPRFLAELEAKVGKDDVVLLLCRSGKRSVAAAQAATLAGFKNVFNVLEGFEGDGGAQQGWLKHGLPSILD